MANQRMNANLRVSLFLQDKPGSHSCIEDNKRPQLGGNLYNPTDAPITITIEPKSRAYIPNLFANTKYAHCEAKFTKTHVTFKCPIGGTTPMFNSAAPRS